MSKYEKLLRKFLSKPKDFTYSELQTLLKVLGYMELKKRRTSGSRIAFINSKTQHVIRLHKPNPSRNLKMYQINYIEEELKNRGVIQ